MRPTPSTSSFASSSHSVSTTTHSTPPNPNNQDASISTLRHLNFIASLPIQFTLAPSKSSADTSSTTTGNSSAIESYYLQVPRVSYLPLLVPVIRKQFLSLVLNQDGGGGGGGAGEGEITFQDADSGEMLKPHWPIGVLYDFHHSTTHHSLPSSCSTDSAPAPSSLTSMFAPLDSNMTSTSPPSFLSPGEFDRQSTLRAPSATSTSRASSRSASSSSHHYPRPTSQPVSSSYSTTQTTLSPWRIILHLPNSISSTSPENAPTTLTECKNQFMNRLKESDYCRFGNSKKKLVNLKKEEQDSLWLGLINNDFVKYWTIGNKLTPLPTTLPTNNFDQDSTTTNFSSNGTGGGDLKNLAIKVYLPPEGGEMGGGGGKVLTLPTSPFDSKTGQPITLGSYLSTILPLLFPPQPYSTPTPKAYPIIQGIRVPLESELNWLASCLGGLDGWLSIVIAVVV
ncbi:autophagy protein 5 [Sporobolomyces salmoneus]|uniref:autophagy protein 5 n=1 Tax=Sporobolomyces salmoneus TaxID=183962 RepID=UPI00316EB3CC